MRIFRGRVLIPLAALGIALLAGGGALAWWLLRPQAEEMPPYSLDGLDPLVALRIERARQQVQAAPRSGEAWGQLGMLLGAYALRPQAVVAFTNAGRFDPDDPRWPYFLGVVLDQEGADSRAVEPFRQAAARAGNKPDAPRLRLAELLLRLGRLADAEEQFRLLLAANPAQTPAALGLARVALAREKPLAAEEEAGRCVRSPFTRKAAHLVLAEARQQVGDQAGAAEALRLAGTFPPDVPWPDPFLDEIEQLKPDRRTRVNHALQVRQQGRLPEYERLMERLESDYPGTLAQMEGRKLLDKKDYRGAEEAFRRAAGQDPEFAQAHFWRGVALLNLGDAAGAAGCFREAVRLQPSHAAAFDYLGRSLVLLQDRRGAIDAFQSSIRYLPQQADVHRRLGELLAAEGRDADALASFERALSLQPDAPGARERVEKARARIQPGKP